MATMAQHADNIIKAANLDFHVVAQATLYDNGADPKWLDIYFADGGADYTDIVSSIGAITCGRRLLDLFPRQSTRKA
jgi:hypothetical protein